MIPILNLSRHADRERVEALLCDLRLDPAQLAVPDGRYARETAAVQQIMADVADRGDEAIVDSARKFDFADFTNEMIRVTPAEMADAAGRVPADQMIALRRSIAQVTEYQTHILPKDPDPLR